MRESAYEYFVSDMLSIILLFCTFLPRIIDEVNIGCTWTLLNLMEVSLVSARVLASTRVVGGPTYNHQN